MSFDSTLITFELIIVAAGDFRNETWPSREEGAFREGAMPTKFSGTKRVLTYKSFFKENKIYKKTNAVTKKTFICSCFAILVSLFELFFDVKKRIKERYFHIK